MEIKSSVYIFGSIILCFFCFVFKINKNQKYKLTLNSMSPEGRDLMETSHLWLSVLRSLTLHIVLCGSLDLLSSAAGGSVSWWVRKTLIYGDNRIFLGVSFPLCSFSFVSLFYPRRGREFIRARGYGGHQRNKASNMPGLMEHVNSKGPLEACSGPAQVCARCNPCTEGSGPMRPSLA